MKDMCKNTIKDREFWGERPLFASHGLRLENVVIHEGESAVKECSDIEASNCRFDGRYPFWHVSGMTIDGCVFGDDARAALWYSEHLKMTACEVFAPKVLREMTDVSLSDVTFHNAVETLWYCNDVTLLNVRAVNADYIMMHCNGVSIRGLALDGKYSFQYSKNIEIRNSVLNTKDAFWETENITVVDSVIKGEYLGWHSKNLRLVNCKISGTQPLCYADNLVLENCTFAEDADLAFEYSSVQATVNGSIASVKNPLTGHIVADGIGEVIIDSFAKQPADCVIEIRGGA